MPAVDLRVIVASASGAAAIVCASMIAGITPAHTDMVINENNTMPSHHVPSNSGIVEATHEAASPQED